MSVARVAFIGLALFVALGLAGCGQKGYPTPEKDASGAYVIHLTGSNTFALPNAQVPAGAKVSFVDDAGSHDVAVYPTADRDHGTLKDSKEAPPAGFGEREMQPGEAWTTTFEAGDYWLVCHMHHELGMSMDLRVTVA
jgi:plastocyanin